MSNTKDTKNEVKFFDKFTKVMLCLMFAILIFIFAAGKYMELHQMDAMGTDNVVNTMASEAASSKSHPFIKLPGDAEVGAFSVANFFAGLIVGHHWQMLFGSKNRQKGEPDTGKKE